MSKLCAICKRFKADPERSITLKYKTEEKFAVCTKCYRRVREMIYPPTKPETPQVKKEAPHDIGTAANGYAEPEEQV